jgi:predicted  nucleic acid-binding Zn-ribbon protein
MEGKKVVVDLEQIDQLEKRIQKATELIRALRRERDSARDGLAQARAESERLETAHRRLEEDHRGARAATEELDILREERQAIRGRVTRMLEMMASLDESVVPGHGDH